MKNKWDQRYSEGTFFYGKEPNDYLVAQINNLPRNGKVLCLAEGEGRNAVYLAKMGFQVTAVDMSSVGLKKLQEFAEANRVNITAVVADLNDYKIEEKSWDAIISIWCHLPGQLRKKVHQQVINGLKKDGVFLLEAYTPAQLELKTGGPDNIDMLMSAHIIEQELSGLSFVIKRELIREIHEGQGHNGQSAVVQILAKKG